MRKNILVVQCHVYDRTPLEIQRELNSHLGDKAKAYLFRLDPLVGLNQRLCIEKLLGFSDYPFNFLDEDGLNSFKKCSKNKDYKGMINVHSGKYNIPTCNRLIGIDLDSRCKDVSNDLKNPSLGKGAYEIAQRLSIPTILLPNYNLERIKEFALRE